MKDQKIGRIRLFLNLYRNMSDDRQEKISQV